MSMSEGIFPTCGCHYTIDDDGIHFCDMHLNAEKKIASLKAQLEAAEKVVEAANSSIGSYYNSQGCPSDNECHEECWELYHRRMNELSEYIRSYDAFKSTQKEEEK